MNGTSVMTALAALAWDRARALARWSAALTAMMTDVIRGNRGHFDERVFALKPHPGQIRAGRWIREDLELTSSEPPHAGRVQERYSLRCAPHVIGVLLDALNWGRGVIEIELNSVNDNPILDPYGDSALHAGNFYGGHIALVMDSLKAAVASVADLLDRQMAMLCNPSMSNGLPGDLVARQGADRFSHLSETVAAMLLLACCQAVDLRGGEAHRRASELRAAVRERVSMNAADRAQDADIATVLDLHRSRKLPLGDVDVA